MEATAVSIISALRENCPNTELFLVRIFGPYLLRESPYLVQIQENTNQK